MEYQPKFIYFLMRFSAFELLFFDSPHPCFSPFDTTTSLRSTHRPVKRRHQQVEYGRKMELSSDGTAETASSAKDADNVSWGNLPDMPTPDALCRMFRKGRVGELGDMYLLDRTAAEKIVRQFGGVRDRVVVLVGCGAGLLARCLLKEKARTVIAIDSDDRWHAMYSALAAADSRFHFTIGDALTLDLERVVADSGAAPSPAAWESESELLVVTTLPQTLTSAIFTTRMLADIHTRSGVFSFGRAQVAFLMTETVINRLLAAPSTPLYGAASCEFQYFLEPSLHVKIPRKSLAGAYSPHYLLLAVPRVETGPLAPVDVLQCARVLMRHMRMVQRLAEKGGKRDDMGFPIMGGKTAPQLMGLYTVLSQALSQGQARRVLDASEIDGSMRISQLTRLEVERILDAINTVADPASMSEPATDTNSRISFPKGQQRTINPTFDPLLRAFSEKRERAVSW